MRRRERPLPLQLFNARTKSIQIGGLKLFQQFSFRLFRRRHEGFSSEQAAVAVSQSLCRRQLGHGGQPRSGSREGRARRRRCASASHGGGWLRCWLLLWLVVHIQLDVGTRERHHVHVRRARIIAHGLLEFLEHGHHVRAAITRSGVIAIASGPMWLCLCSSVALVVGGQLIHIVLSRQRRWWQHGHGLLLSWRWLLLLLSHSGRQPWWHRHGRHIVLDSGRYRRDTGSFVGTVVLGICRMLLVYVVTNAGTHLLFKSEKLRVQGW